MNAPTIGAFIVYMGDISPGKDVQWLLEEKYGGIMSDAAAADIGRLERGEPLDYLIGFTNFLGCKIDLSQHPLIPRPETEFWTEQAIMQIKRIKNSLSVRCLDLFCGSGCVGVAVLKHVPNAVVDFADVEKKFLDQSAANARLNEIDASRWRTVASDVFSRITEPYDYIFANPPYIAEEKKDGVQASVLAHEPYGALFGGADGLSYIRPFLREAAAHLNAGGKIYMEFDTWQKPLIEALLEQSVYKTVSFHRDQYDEWRWVEIERAYAL